jgi:hypothetical protein
MNRDSEQEYTPGAMMRKYRLHTLAFAILIAATLAADSPVLPGLQYAAKDYQEDSQRAEDAYRKAMLGAENKYVIKLQSFQINEARMTPQDVVWLEAEINKNQTMIQMLQNKSIHIPPLPAGSPPTARQEEADRVSMEWSNPDFVDAVKKGMKKSDVFQLMLRAPDADETRTDGTETATWRFRRLHGASDGTSQHGLSGEDAHASIQDSIDAAYRTVPAGEARVEFDSDGLVSGISKSKR